MKVIESIVRRRDQAWNRHDAHEIAALFAPDIDFVDVNGNRFQGRNEYEKEIARLHATTARESIATTESIDVKFLAPEIAVARFRWKMSGWRTADGTVRPAFSGIFIWVLERRNSDWQIIAAQNTRRPE
jgi:uncharacterized protein (TIGR02246 family)